MSACRLGTTPLLKETTRKRPYRFQSRLWLQSHRAGTSRTGSHPSNGIADHRNGGGPVPRSGFWLGDPDAVAEWVAKGAVGSVRTIGGFFGELDAPAQQRLVSLAAVVGAEDERAVHRVLGQQLADLLRRL